MGLVELSAMVTTYWRSAYIFMSLVSYMEISKAKVCVPAVGIVLLVSGTTNTNNKKTTIKVTLMVTYVRYKDKRTLLTHWAIRNKYKKALY